jgi:DNA-binding transcriptional LysR family regulator
MNLRAIDLNLLPVFEAIYAERNLTRAGEVLNVTQPAVSGALARLRQALGDPLFVRAGHGVAPTSAAEALIGPVREGLARLRAGLDVRKPFAAAQSNRAFNIAAGDVAVATMAPVLARRLVDSAPAVRWFFHPIDRDAVAAELASGRLDFAIDIAGQDKPEIESAPLLTEQYVCALRKGHRLARRKLTLEGLVALRHVAVSSRRSGRTLVDLALNRIGLRLHPVMRFVHYAPAFDVVGHSDFALVAPRSLTIANDLAHRPLPLAVPALELRLYWRRENDQEPGHRWARELIVAIIGR